jgi:hypothetical protein
MIPDFLFPYVREGRSVPPDFQRVTMPISLASEESILRSLASSLRGTEAIVTLQGDQATFWRRRVASVGQEYRNAKGAVRTR